MIKVLSIDGGGIRGIIPALILAEIEKRTGKRISELFDLIAGTSTGGILTLGLVMPQKGNISKYTALDLADLYEKEGQVIFSSSIWHEIVSVDGLLAEKYPSAGIDSVLKKFFGDAMLAEALTDVLITSYEIEKRTPWFFKSRKANDPHLENRNVYMREAARSTSAAPTYFKPNKIEIGYNSFALIDGGVFANNPAMCAYVEAITTHRDEKDFLVVSLGTGEHTDPIWYKNAKHWGLANWARPMLNIVFNGVDNVVDYQLRQLLPPQNGLPRYYRFQTKLNAASDRMDDASEDNLHSLKTIVWDMINTQTNMLDTLCRQLLQV
jgi:patatin-like phospholipase/acyl hydrolase